MKKFLTLCTALLLMGSMTMVQATDYYYRGNQNSWSVAIKMTPSIDGYYAYFSAQGHNTLGSNNEFKISLTADSWDYNCSIASPGFNGTDVTDMNSSSNSWGNESWNNAIYHPSDFYILVYFPNTAINSSNNPVMCASTTLPDNTPTVKMGGKFFTTEWITTADFTADASGDFASITLNAVPKGNHEFKVILDNTDWRSTGGTFTRTNYSAVISGNHDNNMTFTADIAGNYTFKWIYASNTLEITNPSLPAQSVSFDGLASQILKGSTPTVFAATSTGITNPAYTFYVKEKNGEYGAAVASYTFNTIGEYVVKVSAEGDNTIDPVIEEENVVVYDTHTFTAGTRIYVDFTAMTEGTKGVNYPKNNEEGYEYDANGAGTFKTIRFLNNVTWSTLNTFIKTEKGGWAELMFSVPGAGQNKIIVAADGASYTWGTYTPETVQVKFFAPKNVQHPWANVYVHSWDAAGNITSWPGEAVTAKDGEWYVYNVQKGASLLFHDNAGMQTNNIENVTAEKCYVSTGLDETEHETDNTKPIKVVLTEQCTVDYYVSGTESLTGHDWGAANADCKLDANNQIVFQNVPAGNHQFKITNGTWTWSLGGKGALKKGACASIAHDEDLENVAFSTDHTQDITITYYPEEDSICLGAETTKSSASISVENMSVYASKTRTIDVTYTSDATPQYEILTGSEYISIADGKITGVAAGEATVRASVAETETYLGASDEFTVTVAALTTAKVKFYAPKTWEHVYAYAWLGGDDQSAAWPGDEVSATDGWYEYDVPVGASVLFTDGVAMKTTDILNVAAAACYVPTGLDRTEHEEDATKPIIVNLAAQCTLDYYLKNKWNGGDWSWIKMTPTAGGQYRLENVVYGGMGINYNIMAADEGAKWKAYANIKYKEGTKEKVVTAYDTINLVLDPANDTIWAEMINKDVTVYTVAGNSLALFDLGWEATHPHKYTDMTKQEDGTYLWNHGGESATLPASWLEIKVIKDRDYANGSWPDEKFSYEITQSGEYDIAIHFNPYTKAIWIDITLVEELNIQNLSIKGSWDWSTATPLTMGGENDKSLITLSLEAGNYEFKLKSANDKWYGNGEAFTRGNNSIKVVQVEGGENMTINVDKTGDYLFTYIFETEQLMIQYPANVPAVKIAPIGGKFIINANGDTAVFARGNLQYNYESDEWYTAEKQYEVLGDLNLRFGDNTYQGSIDMFGWSCESSDYGKQWKYKDEEFSGDFVDWGHLFDGGDTEWSTLSETEWNYILSRTKGGKKLWTMVALSADSLNGLAIFPDDWTAPDWASEMVYGFYNLDDKASYKKNTFTFDEWAEMEEAGAVFLPLGGTRAGYYGNNWSGTAETDLSNPLSSGYDWVDNVNWMGYYWLSTMKSATQVSTAILPGAHNNQWTAPTIWARERRRGQSVRLVTIIPRQTTVVVEEGKTKPASEIYPNDNLIVEAGGKVSGSEALTLNNLIIKTSLGTISSEQEDKNGKSGELEPSSITATGDVWIEIELTQDAQASYGWYAFSVPFQVDALNGVYYGDTKLQNEVGYAIMSFYENKFAAGEYAWKKFRGIMQPGVLYIIAVGDTDYKTLRFKKMAGASIVASSMVPLDKSDEGDNAGWNGVGNPNLRVSHMDAYQYMQFLDHENNSFKTRQAAKTNLMVGTAFMLQCTDAASSIEIKKGGLEGEDIIALAPAREPEAIEKTIFEAKLKNAETGKIEDNLFFTAREDATTTYEAGRDVTKLSIGNAKNAQMTISAYGKQLCAADFPLVNDKASYPIEINAPAAGEYAISAPATAEADIYLTKNGMIIWNLSMNDCTLTLDKGTTEGYGLLLVKKSPEVSTSVETVSGEWLEVSGAQKVVIDNTIFILRGGQMYDVTGKMVK